MLAKIQHYWNLLRKRKCRKHTRIRRSRLSLGQALEQRNMFAAYVDPTLLIYRDVDGDLVSAQFSAPILTSTNVNKVFTFNAGSVNQNTNSPQQLKFINLDNIEVPDGLSFTLKVASREQVGDGKVNLGGFTSTKHAMNDITVQGDLGRVVVGNFAQSPGPTTGMHNLKVNSMGRFGLGTGADNLHSIVNGTLNGLIVADASSGQSSSGGLYGAEIEVRDSLNFASVNGSVLGNKTFRSGSISVKNNIGEIKITGSVIGGSGTQSGRVVAENGAINVISIGNDLKATNGQESGYISAKVSIGSVSIGGSIVGGSVAGSGKLVVYDGSISSVTVYGNIVGDAELTGVVQAKLISNMVVKGDLIGGIGDRSAFVLTDTIHSIEVRNVQGGSGDNSAQIQSRNRIDNFVIGGALKGGGGDDSGTVDVNTLDYLSVGIVLGGLGENSGQVRSNRYIGYVFVRGNLVGGDGDGSGSIRSNAPDVGVQSEDIKFAHVLGDIKGGLGNSSGSVISSHGQIYEVLVNGSIRGGSGKYSGSVVGDKSIFAIHVGGDVIGGSDIVSGTINSTRGALGSVSIDGNLTSGVASSSGAINGGGGIGKVNILGNVTGRVTGFGDIPQIKIGGSLIGDKGNTGVIFSSGRIDDISIAGDISGGKASSSGVINAGSIGSLTVTGNITSGVPPIDTVIVNSGSIRARDSIDTILVMGSLIGNTRNPVSIAARGQANQSAQADIAINSITILGNAFFSKIIAGQSDFFGRNNPDAQIGTIVVGGNWTASSAVAGISPGEDGIYGTRDDAKFASLPAFDNPNIRSKIGSLTIKGNLLGTVANNKDFFGIEAQEIVFVSIQGVSLGLKNGPSNDSLLLGSNLDILLREFK